MMFSGSIAQWLEQETHNFLAGGSNPSRPTILSFESSRSISQERLTLRLLQPM